nr:MAG TPA: hypothetical protein [Inoviridae sp.]
MLQSKIPRQGGGVGVSPYSAFSAGSSIRCRI